MGNFFQSAAMEEKLLNEQQSDLDRSDGNLSSGGYQRFGYGSVGQETIAVSYVYPHEWTPLELNL